ncbi:MAG TPA: phosphatidylglycerol lysyltransferase domain-containing protein [Acidimicrobiales bacterium]|nr:phosphatidylglycerol lysyltransferase domain-containing protein [Acidimicrobiales bacterium]
MLTVPQYASDVIDELSGVLAVCGHEAGQYSVLGPDPWRVVWNAERSGFVSFLEGRRALLMWRSPVARAHDQSELLTRVNEYAESVDKPLFAIEVNDAAREAGVALGMTSIWIGTESFLDLASWSIAGGRRQKVRWARNHALKMGLSWREAFPLGRADDHDSLRHVENLWRDERTERTTDSFLRTDFLELASLRRYFACEGPSGVIAFVSCTPVSSEGWYLQDIVREPDAPRGALEGAMALALDTFRDEGFTFVSNGQLPFWRPHEFWSDPDQLGAIGNRVLKFFDRQYRFHGINQFRSKFEPDRLSPFYVLRTRRLVTPGVARSLTKMLNTRLR